MGENKKRGKKTRKTTHTHNNRNSLVRWPIESRWPSLFASNITVEMGTHEKSDWLVERSSMLDFDHDRRPAAAVVVVVRQVVGLAAGRREPAMAWNVRFFLVGPSTRSGGVRWFLWHTTRTVTNRYWHSTDTGDDKLKEEEGEEEEVE